METHTIQAPPCPICGESAFACDEDSLTVLEMEFWPEEMNMPRLVPRTCSECGNVLVLATR